MKIVGGDSIPRIVGADPALVRYGVSIIDLSRTTWREMITTQVLKSKKTDPMFVRQTGLMRDFAALLRPGDQVVFEDWSVGARFEATANLIERTELMGLVKVASVQKTKNPFMLCSPTRLKSFAANDGSASKLDVKEAVENFFHVKVRTHDESDATALALIAFFALRSKQLGPCGLNLVLPDIQLITTTKQQQAVKKFTLDNKRSFDRSSICDAFSFSR